MTRTSASPPGRESDLGTTATVAGVSPPPTPASAAGPSPIGGRRLAHFRLERRLGQGGMGEVWLATDLALERPVAVKLLSRDFGGSAELRERFYREARAQARVKHANVATIHYIGEDDGQLFYAMEYIEGESLAARLERSGKLPAHEALELTRQAALGLREAERHGFTHRDVKPSNLMIDHHGQVKLVDFGLVKAAGKEDVALTREGAGVVMGTPLYMAPEQARGEPVDFRTDIYALGATLHHLVTGAPPFTGDTALALVSKHLSDPRPAVPGARRAYPALDPLLDRMMAKRPADRFASYDDLIEAIDQAQPALHRAAGFFPRAFAFALDTVLLALVAAPSWGALVGDRWDDAAVWLTMTAYHTLGAWRFGRTFGKWVMDLEVVADGKSGRPTAWQAVTRTTWQWGPFLVGLHVLLAVAEQRDLGETSVDLTVVIACALAIAWPFLGGLLGGVRRDKRPYWDRLARTKVRYAHPKK